MKYKYPLFLLCLVSHLSGMAQDTLRFSQSTFINEQHSLESYAGGVIELGPGVLLIVEGSLCLEGDEDHPVEIINQDPLRPAIGIQVQGQNASAKLKIRYVHFKGLVQALRFDPFWQRDQVLLTNLNFSGSTSGEPVFYLGDPFVDLREGSELDIEIRNLQVQNNRAGIVIEAYGTPQVNYEIDQILFRDNYFDGPEQSVMHLEIYKEAKDLPPIGELIFDRNRFEYQPLYISLSSNFDQELDIKSVATEATFVPVLDQTIDSRIGRINIEKLRPLNSHEQTDYSVIGHSPGVLSLRVKQIERKNLLFKLLDARSQSLDFDFSVSKDTIFMKYQGEEAKFLELANSYKVVLPKLDSNLLEPENEEVYVEEKLDLIEDEANSSVFLNSVEIGAQKAHDFFTRNTQSLKSWELGLWGGGALYGAGDIKPKFSLIDDVIYFPSTIDLSIGAYLQYNFNTRFSARLNYYNSTISIHDFSAAGFFSGTAPLMGHNEEYEEVELDDRSYQANFITNMNILELEGIWHLRPYRLPANKWSTLVPAFGLSIGAMRFTPYRTRYLSRLEDENYFEYLERAKPTRINLRELGSEGQNFLPGAEPYSQLAFTAGLSFSTTWLFRNFALKGEIRGQYTSTDYLDDYGPGLWYGGDRNSVLEHHQTEATYRDISRVIGNLDLPRDNISRSVDGLNDWYFQGHLGLSIFLDKARE